LKSIPIDPPMLSINIHVNTSPIAGKEGAKISANHIKERLIKESENDVALHVSFGDKPGEKSEGFEIQGRGDLHLGILIEKMRREGYEMAITPPNVVMKKEGSKILEPIENVSIEIAHEYTASIIDNMNDRKAVLITSEQVGNDKQKYC
jgi:GTP-binding protein